jgi:hypothetical protein
MIGSDSELTRDNCRAVISESHGRPVSTGRGLLLVRGGNLNVRRNPTDWTGSLPRATGGSGQWGGWPPEDLVGPQELG